MMSFIEGLRQAFKEQGRFARAKRGVDYHRNFGGNCAIKDSITGCVFEYIYERKKDERGELYPQCVWVNHHDFTSSREEIKVIEKMLCQNHEQMIKEDMERLERLDQEKRNLNRKAYTGE